MRVGQTNNYNEALERLTGLRVVGLLFGVGFLVGCRVVGLVGLRVVGLLVGRRVDPWSFRDTFIVLASSSPLFSTSPPVRKTRSLVSVVEVADTHPFCGCQMHSPVPARHEIFAVKDAQSSSMVRWRLLPRND
jgi:hypothetical protein